jgi:CSLREA domain-containing protein
VMTDTTRTPRTPRTPRTRCTPRRQPYLGTALLGLITVTASLLLSGATRAAVITVTDYVDDANDTNGTCTLREAVRSANTNASVDGCVAGSAVIADRIRVQAGTHLVDLGSGADEDNAVTGDVDILDDVRIVGASPEFSIIDGTSGATDRLFHIHDTANDVTIEGVALRGGNAGGATPFGGVLFNEESGVIPVELIEVEVSGGTATAGAGIFSAGNLLVRRSQIIGNQATNDPGSSLNHGGGIVSAGMSAQLRVEDSEISGNDANGHGAGIFVSSGQFSLFRSRVIGNVAGASGGGLYVASADFIVDYVDFSSNEADLGGGVFFAGAGEVQHSAFVDNEATSSGGGLYDAAGGFARFSTFSGNTAPTGAGIYADTSQTLLDSNTIASNNGDGVFNQSGVFFENGLLAQNPGGNCTGTAPAFGAFNLEDANSCGFVSGVDMPNFPNTNPMLGPLQDNGGPTATMALLPGSPAIDVVTSEIRMNCEMIADQRGYPRGRPRTTGGGGADVFLCDIGAFEATVPFVVDSLADVVDDDLTDDLCRTTTGDCTLRAAIQQANLIPGMIEIELGAGTHLLAISGSGEDDALTGDLDVDTPVTIRGVGAGLTTVDAGDVDRAFDIGIPAHVATNAPEVSFVEDLTITGGDAGPDNGGAIATLRDLRVQRVVLSGNYARRGSAISSVRTAGTFGVDPSVVEVVDSTATLNSGALPLFLATARVTGSSLIDNTATIATNGGAGEFGRLRLTNSTVSGNHADATGAFFAGQAVIESSTIYGNSGNFSPGGVFLLELSVFHNSIIADNLAGVTPDQCAFNPLAITSFGYNVSGTGPADCDLTEGTDQTLTDPLLDPLANNGGLTLTHLPGAGSPAIDSGDPLLCPPLDQRGSPRPADGDLNGSSVCDVGAVEVPEPATVIGLLAGGLGLAGLARHRGRRSILERDPTRALASRRSPGAPG